MNLTLKKKFALIALLLCCITIVSCAQKEPELRKVNKSEHSTNQLQKEIESELYDTSGQNNLEWGGAIVENSKCIYYTSETALIQIEKDTMEKSVIRQWEKDSNRTISLYCTESELFYIQDMREVYLIRLKDGKQQLFCTSEMLEQEGYTFPEIWGMAVYSGHIYLELCGFDVVQCELNGDIGDKIARDARSGAFWGNVFFYGKRSSNEIYRVDLKSMEESVVREKKYEERVQYNDIFTIDDNLYYDCEGTIYLYDESGKDVKIIEDSGLHVDGKDAIYYIKEEGNVEYLYKFNVQTKQISSRKIRKEITDEDYITEARVICNMLFYKKRDRDEEEDHIEMWGADIVADAGRWSKNLVANERYMFFITKNQIIRCDRRTNKKKIIVQCDEETDIKLCLDDKFLYYLLNGENIYRVDFSGDETKKVVSLNVLKKNGIRISSISGMKIYHNKLYLYEIIYGYVIEFTPEKNKIKLIAKCVRDADFFNESLYYVDESKRCIYKVNLETGKEEVARQGVEKGEKGFIYSDILSVGGRLYYLRKDKKQIFCYSENREDVIIGEKMKYSRLIESIDNKLYYCCYEKETYDANNSFYLGSYDGNENSILRLLPEDYYLPAMVIGNKLYYQVVESEEDNTNHQDYYKEYVTKEPDIKTMIQKAVGEDVEIIDYKTIADSPQSLFCFAVIAHENQKKLLVIKHNEDEDCLFTNNRSAVMQEDEGGVYGDPFDGMSIENNQLVLHFYGGSASWRWIRMFTFSIIDEDIILSKYRFYYFDANVNDQEDDDSILNMKGSHEKVIDFINGIKVDKRNNNDKIETQTEKLGNYDFNIEDFNISQFIEKFDWEE